MASLGIDVFIRGLGGINQLSNSLNRIERQGNTVANSFRLLRAAIVATGAVEFYKQAIQLQQQTEKFTTSLAALTGNLQRGGIAFKLATSFAQQYGFEQEKVLKATQALLLNGVKLSEIPQYYEAIGRASRATGQDIDTIASEFVKIKEGGLESSKILSGAMENILPNSVVNNIRENGRGAEREFLRVFGTGGAISVALQGTTNQTDVALTGLKANFDKFTSAFFGTDNADKINIYAKIIDFLAKNMTTLKIAVAAAAAVFFGPFGWIAAAVLAFDAAVDLYQELKKEPPVTAWKNRLGILGKSAKDVSKNIDETTDSLNGLNNTGITGAFEKTIQSYKDLKDVIVDTPKPDLTFLQELSAAYTFTADGITAAWKKIQEENSIFNAAQKTTIELYSTLKAGASDALVSIINGSKSAAEAGRAFGQIIRNAIIKAFVDFVIIAPLMAAFTWVLEKIAEKFGIVKDKVKETNSELRKQIGYQLLLKVLSFGLAGGGPVEQGGQPVEQRAMGGTTPGRMPYLVGEKGPELFVPNASGTIIPNDQLFSGSNPMQSGTQSAQTVNVNFSISTVDATGFDQLLTSRRGLIVGVVQEALNRQGRRL
jgi:hypothetical protein